MAIDLGFKVLLSIVTRSRNLVSLKGDFFFFETGSVYITLAVLELTEMLLPLPPLKVRTSSPGLKDDVLTKYLYCLSPLNPRLPAEFLQGTLATRFPSLLSNVAEQFSLGCHSLQNLTQRPLQLNKV